jgi:hypothetical protein
MRKPADRVRFVVTRQLRTAVFLCAAMAMIGFPAARAQTADAGMLNVPARSVPVPSSVSPQMAKIIGPPLRTNWNVLPRTGEEWKPVADAGAAVTIKLQVYEDQSHAQHYRDDTSAEAKEAFEEIAGFFDKHLGK